MKMRWILGLLLVTACGDDVGPPDLDTTTYVDTSVPDAAPISIDASPIENAGAHDAAAITLDAGELVTTSVTSSEVEAGVSTLEAVSEAGVMSEPITDSGVDAEVPLPDATPVEPTCILPDIPGSECSIELNCGCSDGDVCRIANIQTEQTLCFSAGSREDYASCEADQDCQSGSVCEGFLCRPSCDTPGAFCSDDSWCEALVEGGRTVCQGHCNVLPLALGGISTSAFWIELQQKQLERGFIPRAWTQDYVPCGEGAYCHPGIQPLKPYPHCTLAFGSLGEGQVCGYNEDCQTGLACYEKRCRIIGASTGSCPSGTDVVGAIVDPDYWGAPDNYNNVKPCIPK